MSVFRVAVVLLGLLAAAPAAATPYPEHLDLYVNDYSDVLSPEVEDHLRERIRHLKDETGVEMTLLTIPTRRAFDPTPSIEDFATGLFNTWGIGSKELNDGILVLVATEDREMRLELGAGYNQGYDVLARDVVDRYFLPEFQNGDYEAGIKAGTLETIARIARRNAEGLEAEPMSDWGGKVKAWIVWAMMALIAALIVARRFIGDLVTRVRRCPVCGTRHLTRSHETVTEATTGQDGLRRVVTACSSCSYRDARDIPVPAKGRSASGGSFGGGKSSGGGATGRW